MANVKDKTQNAIDAYNKKSDAAVRSLGKLDKSTEKFRRSRGSIVASAKSNIFEFPVFVSSSIPIDYATATNSLLEQVYASYLQMAISLNPVIDHTLVKNGLQFSHLKSDTGRYVEYTDTDWQHDVCHNEFIEEGCSYEFNMITIPDSDNRAIMEYVNHQPLSEFDHFFTESNGSNYESERYSRQAQSDIADKKKNLDEMGETLKSHISRHAEATEKANEEAKKYEDASSKLSKATKEIDDLKDRLKSVDAKEKKELKDKIKTLEDERKTLENANRESKSKNLQNTKVSAPKILKSSDMDKLNTLKPMMMTVDINVASEDGHLSPVQYVVGAKTFCRLIDADTIPEVAEYPLKEMNKIVRKAKWRAGELKFFSDIVFHIKQKKQTAVDSRNPKRKWYRRLYELAHMKGDAPTTDIVKGNSVIASFVLDKMGKPRSAHGVIPDCTLVISKTDVDICKMKTDIDLLDGSTASKLCNELFLIGIVVIDTDQESIKILLPDLHNDYDVHSLASVNRQMAQLDFNSVKQKEFNKFIG